MIQRCLRVLESFAFSYLAGAFCGAEERPNIVYIMTDDHATQMMSAYDTLRAATPNLDKIGEEGIRF